MSRMNQKTKAKILAAAETVFHENGFKGARTTLIAKKAGVSRTMLHYYYSTKEELFQEVLQHSFGFFLQHAQDMFTVEGDLKTMIEQLIDLLYEVLTAKPGLASFMVNILNDTPEMITALPVIQEEKLPARLDELLDQAKREQQIKTDITGENLLLNIYGLCVIPYLTAPLIRFKENRSEQEMHAFLQQRKDRIKAFVWNGMQK
ncbi:MAG: TetR/AcrR family transcriptional regulator [Saprospiraceae bacterium]|nr:TetR/AcrR family transcriptional regulator [Saprospiraceae bacterium]